MDIFGDPGGGAEEPQEQPVQPVEEEPVQPVEEEPVQPVQPSSQEQPVQPVEQPVQLQTPLHAPPPADEPQALPWDEPQPYGIPESW